MRQLDALLVGASLVFLVVLLYGLAQMTRQTWNQTTGLLAGFRLGYVYLGVSCGVLACIAGLGRRLRRLWRGERVPVAVPLDAA